VGEAPTPDIEVLLVLLVSNCEANLRPYKHLRAAHEIVHDCFELGKQRLPVNDIKENALISRHLDADVAFADLTTVVIQLVVVGPLAANLIFLEEQY
jgi:hypothetical protein